MLKTLKADAIAKNGTTIKAGEKVDVRFDVKLAGGTTTLGAFSMTATDGRRVSSRNLSRLGIKAPSISTLGKYMDDGIAKSVFGARVECDGVDANGAPSWLLFLGMI